MSSDARIYELLDEVLESDRSPEEVCAQAPELLDEVRRRLMRLRGIEAQVDLLFPLSRAPTEAARIAPARLDAELLSIHGYELLSILGRGGMGVVYQARHLKLNRTVALKMLLSGSLASEQEQARFVREAEAVAGLRHPNVVQIYDFGEVSGMPYFTMEYIAGGTLAAKLASAPPPVRDSAQIVATLAEAVFAAHQSGIIHRDLKPANILLAENNTPKISDFGLARRLDGLGGLTHTGARIGTPSYMAPEQMTGGSAAVGRSVDIFALGAMLYEMLTGRPPFQGASLSETERKLTKEEPVPPSRVNAKVPRDLETICLKCLEKEPRARYATAGELAADLERFLRHEPIHARPIALAERGLRWIRRNPLPAALAATSIVLIGLIANQALQEWSSSAARRAEKNRLTARLESGIQLVQSARFAEAQAILGKLGDGGFEDLRQRIDRVLIDLALAEKLDAIGVKRAMALNAKNANWNPHVKAGADYKAALAAAGLGKLGDDDPGTVAKRIKDSDIEAPLIAAFDDWAVCESAEQNRRWILEVARRADAEQLGWQNQYRDPATWNDRTVLARLAETAFTAKPSVQQLRVLGDRLAAVGLDATPFREQVQRNHVDIFLANLSLGDSLRATVPSEAIRYYQAALAIRPHSATAHNNLAVALASLGRSAEAILQYQQALALDPNSAIIEYNLGLELSKSQALEAIPHLQKSIELNPGLAVPWRTLGEVFLREKRHAEALECLQRCLALLGDGDTERPQVLELLERCQQQIQMQHEP